MKPVTIIALLIALVALGTLFTGWRDGWLRGKAAAAPVRSPSRFGGGEGARCNYVGIAEVARFGPVRRRIGYRSANAIVQTLADRIADDPGFEIGRVGRTSVEFLYRAEKSADAQSMMRDLKQKLEQSISTPAITFEPEIVIGSNPVALGQLDDQLFDLSAFAVEDARKLPGRISFTHESAMSAAIDQSARMLPNLVEAIRSDQLDLQYMPKLCLTDRKIASAEALCRWTHPDHGVVPPMTFVRLAEETELIGDLTLWTVQRAIADQGRLIDLGHALDIDVNLSGQLVSNAAFCEQLIERIADARGRIGLEITETAVIEEPEAALANLRRMADAGIHIAIDDFGSGLSSLSYLRDLPAQELKIDQSFVRALTTSHRDPLLVRSAIDIAHALDMQVTAEGVEDEIAMALLKVMRCDHVQGYHISKPLPLGDLAAFLAAGSGGAATEGVADLRSRLMAAGGRA